MIRERVDSLRKLMDEHGVQAYIIPSTDPHQSEYTPAYWQRRQWISGLTLMLRRLQPVQLVVGSAWI